MAKKGINFVISVDNKQADTAIRSTQQSFRNMASQMKGLGSNVDNAVNNSFSNIGKSVKKTATEITASMASIGKSMLGFTAFQQGAQYVREFVGEIGSFKKAMTEVSTISSQVAGDMDGFSNKVLQMTSQIPVGATESAKALYQIESASHHGADALNILEQSAKAAIGGVTDTATAADAITTILNAYHMSADQAQAVSDKLFMTVRNGKTTWNELAHSIANVAPAAASYGVSLDEMLAAIATMTKQGVQTANAVTQLNAVITAGTSALGDGAFRSRSFADAIAMIEHAANGSDLALKAELGNVRAMRAVFTLGGDSAKLFANDLNDISNSAGSASSAYEKMSNTLGAQQKLLKNNITNLLTDLVGGVNASLKDVVKYINKAFETGEAQKFVNAIKELVIVYGSYRATIIATNAVMKIHKTIMEATRLEMALAKMASIECTTAQAMQAAGLKVLSRAWNSLTTSMLANPVMWVVGAITALVYATYKLVTADSEAEVAQKSLNRQIDDYNNKTAEARNKTNEFIDTLRDQNKTLYQQEKAYKDLIKQRGVFAKYSMEQLKSMSQDDIDKLINQSDQEQELQQRANQIKAIQNLIHQIKPIEDLNDRISVWGANSTYAKKYDKQYGLEGSAFSLQDIYDKDMSIWTGTWSSQWEAVLNQNKQYLAQMKSDIADANIHEALIPQSKELEKYYTDAEKAVDVYLDAIKKIPETSREGNASVAKLSSTATTAMNTVRNTILRKKAELQIELKKNPTDVKIQAQIENYDRVLADIETLATLIQNGGKPWAIDVLVNYRKGKMQFDASQFAGLDFANKPLTASAFQGGANKGVQQQFPLMGINFSNRQHVAQASAQSETKQKTSEETYKQQQEAEKARQKAEQARQKAEAKREQETRKKQQTELRKFERTIKQQREQVDTQMQIENAETALLSESKTKSAQKALDDYNKSLETLRREYEDIRKQRYNDALAEWQENNPDWAKKGKTFDKTLNDFQLTSQEQEAWDKRNEVARQAYEKQIKEANEADLQYMLNYLKEYGNMQEQRYALAQLYDAKIAKSNNEYEKKSLLQEKQKALSDKDNAYMLRNIDFASVFDQLGGMIKEPLEDALKELRAYTRTDGFKGKSTEEKKAIYDAINNAESKLQWQLSDLDFKKTGRDLDAYNDAVIKAKNANEQVTTTLARLQDAQKEYEKALKTGNSTVIKSARQNLDNAKTDNDKANQDKTDADNKQAQANENLKHSATGLAKSLENVQNVAQAIASGSASQVWKSLPNEAQKSVTDALAKAVGGKSDFISQMIGAILSILDILKDGIGTLISGLLDSIFDAVSGLLKNILSGKFLEQIVSSIREGWDNVLNSVTLGGFHSWIGSGGNASKVAKEEERLNKQLERVTTALDKLREQLDDSKGGYQTIEAGQKALQAAQKKEELNQKKLENRMGYHNSHHSNTHYLRDALKEDDYDAISEVVGRDIRSVDDIYKMSSEEMSTLRANDALTWDKLVTTGKYDWEEYWDAMADAGDDAKEIVEQIQEKLTSTSFDSVYNGFRDMLMDMDSSLQDFSDDASEMIYKALMGNFVADKYQKQLKEWYEKMAKYLQDQNGDLTQTQIKDLTNEYTEMAKSAQKQRDYIAQITGYAETSSQQGSTKGFNAMDQDTASELNGRFTALQASGESISTAMQNSLSQLIDMNITISNGVGILDDIRTLHALANSMLSDVVTNTNPLRELNEKIDKLIHNTNNL